MKIVLVLAVSVALSAYLRSWFILSNGDGTKNNEVYMNAAGDPDGLKKVAENLKDSATQLTAKSQLQLQTPEGRATENAKPNEK